MENHVSPESHNYCYQTRIGEGESPFATIVRALAVAEGVEPTALPPLYDRLDPDALDALLVPSPDSDGEPPVVVEIPLEAYRIHVTNDGTITILENSVSS